MIKSKFKMSFMEQDSLIILLSCATLINIGWLYLNKAFLKMNRVLLILMSLFHTLFGVLFVFIFAYIESGFNIESLGNLSLYGGVFFMPIVYLCYALARKIDIGRTFDIFTISIVSTLFFARINCLISGCCVGVIIGSTNLRFPSRELELFFYALFIIFAAPSIYKGKNQGYYYPIYMVSYGIFRFFIEFFRFDSTNYIFHIGHLWSAISIIIGLVFIFIIKYCRGKKSEKEMVSK